MNQAMNTRLASLVIVASTVVSSYIVLLIGYIIPRFFAQTYGIESANDLGLVIPPITKFAAAYAWEFAVPLVLICLCTILLARRFSTHLLQLLSAGLCAQGLIMWFAMFCYCYEGLTGGVSLHHEPSFSFNAFSHFGFGIFPATLLALLLPLLATFFHRRQ